MTIGFNVCFFLLRFYWSFKHPLWLDKKFIKWLSYLNDTMLLASAILLLYLTDFYFLSTLWLSSKLLLLLAYILFGHLALKANDTVHQGYFHGLLAIFSIFGIIYLAIYKPV